MSKKKSKKTSSGKETGGFAFNVPPKMAKMMEQCECCAQFMKKMKAANGCCARKT